MNHLDLMFMSKEQWTEEVIKITNMDRPDLEQFIRHKMKSWNFMEITRTAPHVDPAWLGKVFIQANPPPVIDYQI